MYQLISVKYFVECEWNWTITHDDKGCAQMIIFHTSILNRPYGHMVKEFTVSFVLSSLSQFSLDYVPNAEFYIRNIYTYTQGTRYYCRHLLRCLSK